MSSVGLALDDVGLAIRLQETLEGAGHRVHWDASLTRGPQAGQTPGVPGNHPSLDAVAVGGDADSPIEGVIAAWRGVEPAPAILVIGSTPRAKQVADQAKATFVPADADPAQICDALATALQFRNAVDLTPAHAAAHVGVPVPQPDPSDPSVALQQAIMIIAASRKAELGVIREALRPHAGSYLTAQSSVETLREHRALVIPEVELLKRLDGTQTVRTAIGGLGMDASAAARLVWVLLSVGAVTASPEPPDVSTRRRRALQSIRDHIRARQSRLAHATPYDVLEIPRGASLEQLQQAVQLLAAKYGPERLASFDLGDLTPVTGPLWQQVVKSAEVLANPAHRNSVDQGLAARDQTSLTPWASGAVDHVTAEQRFATGQKALIAGDAFRAVSEFAAACRVFPDQPDYEVSLAWARYRADLARGKPREDSIKRERQVAEEFLAGRRPWPRAQVALALLCASDEDPRAARWHLNEALRIAPNLPTAQKLLERLGTG